MARVVVVGGGLGGAASAARLAKLGHTVTVLERRGVLGGALGFVEEAGYRWDSGPSYTSLPAVVRDLFRKSGRQLDRVLDLVPVEPMREHRWEDGSVLSMPSGSRAAQVDAVDAALGEGLGTRWADYTHGFAEVWDRLRRDYLERRYSPDHVERGTRDLLRSRVTLHRSTARVFRDERLRDVATMHAVVDGHHPRNVPWWTGVASYVEQRFGTWTVPGGMGLLAQALATRLDERRVDVRVGVEVFDVVVRDGAAVGVDTGAGTVDADVVVCAVDPRRLPALAPYVRRTMPAFPPTLCHVGLRGDVPRLPHEVVLHGDPTLVVRTHGTAPAGCHAWTLSGRGRLAEDVLTALARRGIDVRGQLEVRVDRSPRELVETWGGSPYGVLWQGRSTLSRRMGTVTPVAGVLAAGAHAGPGSGIPFVGLGAALVAEAVGRA